MSIAETLEWPGKFLANGGHAQQDIPSQHRLLNASGMFLGWWALERVRNIVFGVKMQAEGEYVEMPLEDVPAPLRFLHKAIDWQPHSEAPEHQWKKLAYQMMPGIGAGLGAVAGSMYAFERNGRAQTSMTLKGLQKLNLLDAEFVAQYSQSKPLRALTAFFGTFSAASGLTPLYGLFLNNAFMASNGARMYVPGAMAKGNLAPHRAAEGLMGMLEPHVAAGKSEAWAKQFVERVMQPMFGHELATANGKAKAVKTLQAKAQGYLSEFKAKPQDEKRIKEFGNRIAEDLVKTLHLDPKKAKLGNANPIVHGFQEVLNTIGFGTHITVGEQPKKTTSSMGYGVPLAGAAAAGVGAVAMLGGGNAQAAEIKQSSAANETSSAAVSNHSTPDATGKTSAEYVADAMALHHTNNGTAGAPPKWLKWMGDAQLAMLPTNRLYCAIGLTAGLMFAGNMAKIATGYGLDMKPVEAAKVPTYLKWMHKSVKDYNPKGFRPRDRYIKYAQWATYSLGGLLGIKWGTDYAYKNVENKNADPHYIEDYLPRVAMHQGETWSWLAAFSGIFGSASGLFNLPVPGLNYAIGLAARATSMQDRNFMLPVLNDMMSGATTTSFLRLREGMNYLCHYAANAPEHTPAQIEFLAYTLLGPIFKDNLTARHIQQFTEAVHEVRDKYWQEGGIPKAKRKEALKTMKEVFTGAGQEVLLIDLGLNPGTIDFLSLNGLTGTIGNIGIKDKIHKEQENYQSGLLARVDTYVKEKLISQQQADWVKAGIQATRKGAKEPPPPAEEMNIPTAPVRESEARPSFTERTTLPQNRLKDLLDRAEQPGNWRKKAKLPEEHAAPAALGA